MGRITKTICEICNHSCFAPFECERKSWQKDPNRPVLPKVGKGDQCPLLQFEAFEDTDPRPLWQRPYDPVTEADTWAVCEECEFSRIDSYGEVSVDFETYEKYCMDCPNGMKRESIQETKAEALMS